MGEIRLILIHHSDFVYFVVRRQRAVVMPDFGIHSVTEVDQDTNYMCVKQEDLLDYHPLMGYKLNGTPVIILHHSLPDTNMCPPSLPGTDMATPEEGIKEAVFAALPSLPEDKVESLLVKLASIGVECRADLCLVTEADLNAYGSLTPIQCRKLLNAWKMEGMS